jgi:sulfur-oxidizing protein SoxZ
MSDSIKVRAKVTGGVTEVKALINHTMETGQRKDAKTGQIVPAHFIQEITCSHNGENVLTAQWGVAISKNPYLSFNFSGAKAGDSLKVSWVDNKGETDSVETKIS